MTTFHLLPCDCESHLKIMPSVDQGVMTCDANTYIAIVDLILDARNQEKEDSEKEEVQDPRPPAKPSIEQMQDAIDLMRT